MWGIEPSLGSVSRDRSNLQIAFMYDPVQEDLDKVELNIHSLAKVKSPWLTAPLEHILDDQGKRLRPALTLLSGKFYTYDLDLLIPMSTATEILHIASLVHDDTIDGATTRRGKATISALMGKTTAVLVGDYLFANAAELVSRTRNVDVMRLFAETLMAMADSELGQSTSTHDLGQTRTQYYERIRGKTASLLAMATESGARLSGAPSNAVDALKDYGYNLGMAFQIADDILDFVGQADEVGKPVGADLRQGIITLPMILLLERIPNDSPIRRMFDNKQSEDNVKLAIEMIRESPIIAECRDIAMEFCSRARHSLQSLPDNTARQTLHTLTDYVIERKS